MKVKPTINQNNSPQVSDVEAISSLYSRLQICPLYIFGNKPPQMVPMDLDIGFQRLALIHGQIYNPVIVCLFKVSVSLQFWLIPSQKPTLHDKYIVCLDLLFW